jgi:hypothetical protein
VPLSALTLVPFGMSVKVYGNKEKEPKTVSPITESCFNSKLDGIGRYLKVSAFHAYDI